jgi:predicted Zn finger-like uncharacterized protein
MRIACPSCAIAYEVPDPLLKPGRAVRCASCGSKWSPSPVEAVETGLRPVVLLPDRDLMKEPAAPSPPRDTMTAMDMLAAGERRKGSSPLLAAAWLVSAVVLVGTLLTGVVLRQSVTAAWPASERLYDSLGIPVLLGPGSAARMDGQPTLSKAE